MKTSFEKRMKKKKRAQQMRKNIERAQREEKQAYDREGRNPRSERQTERRSVQEPTTGIVRKTRAPQKSHKEILLEKLSNLLGRLLDILYYIVSSIVNVIRNMDRRRLMMCGGVVVLVIIIAIVAGVTSHRKGHSRRAKDVVEESAEPIEGTISSVGPDVTLGFTGCMLLHGPIVDSGCYQHGGEYDFSDIYTYITEDYSAPDFMACEFEGVLYGKDYRGYPTFHTPDVLVQNVADSGVDLQFLATNHMYDGVQDGFMRTMDVFDEKGLAYTGIRQTPEDKPYYIADVKGYKIGIIDYTYETDGPGIELNSNPIPSDIASLINTLDYYNGSDELDKFYSDMEQYMKDMRADGAEFLIAAIHWGEEYHLTEDDYQREIAQKLCDMGLDAIIGGHPHCEQPIDVLQSTDGKHDMFCVYSVGNALSNQNRENIGVMPEGHTEDGVIVNLDIHSNEDGKVVISDVNLIPTWVYRRGTDDGNQYYILPVDDPAGIAAKTGFDNLEEKAQASYDRTMGVMGAGLEKAKRIFNEN